MLCKFELGIHPKELADPPVKRWSDAFLERMTDQARYDRKAMALDPLSEAALACPAGH